MGDASRKRLLIAAAAVAASMLGLGAAAEAGLLSRAEADGDSARGAGAAIADPSDPGQDVVAVSETTAEGNDEGKTSGATLLRVGDLEVGEAPDGDSELLGPILNGGPTEEYIDAGCDDSGGSLGVCVTLLRTSLNQDDGFAYSSVAEVFVAQGEDGGTVLLVLPSAAEVVGCNHTGAGAILFEGTGQSIDYDEVDAPDDDCT